MSARESTCHHSLLQEWAQLKTRKPPYVLPGDEWLLEEDSNLICRCDGGWKEFVRRADCVKPRDFRFHVSLLPIPYVGDLSSAQVYFLMLNPGLGPHDYFGDYEIPRFRRSRIGTLKQAARKQPQHFRALDPRHSWHGGFRYWHTKLRDIISAISEHEDISYMKALQRVRKAVACIELVPYHSATFKLPSRYLDRLRSTQLARQYVHDVLLPRARRGQCLVIVARSARYWGVREGENVVVYEGSAARSAHLTRNSAGGNAILDFMTRVY